MDYLSKLSPKELEWLNKFNGEYANASFDPSPGKNLHKSKKMRKDCYDRNNARNRCVLTRQKAQGMDEHLEGIMDVLGSNPEDDINTKLDLQTEGYLDNDYQIIKKG